MRSALRALACAEDARRRLLDALEKQMVVNDANHHRQRGHVLSGAGLKHDEHVASGTAMLKPRKPVSSPPFMIVVAHALLAPARNVRVR
jgi:hypothetical protein